MRTNNEVVFCAPPTPDCSECRYRFAEIQTADRIVAHVEKVGVRYDGRYGTIHGRYTRSDVSRARATIAAAWEAIEACPCQSR